MQEEFAFKACIEKNFGALKSGVKMSRVADFLIEKGVLKLGKWRNLKSMEIEEDERTEQFLFDLHEKTVNEFQIFIEALRNKGYEEMASTLEITYSHILKKCAKEGDPSNRLDLLHEKGIQAQAPIETEKREKSSKSEETNMGSILQSMCHDHEKKIDNVMEENRRMMQNVLEENRKEQRRIGEKMIEDQKLVMGAGIDKFDTGLKRIEETMSTKFQRLELEMGKFKADVQRELKEHMQLTEENKRLISKLEEKNKEIDTVYLQLDQLLKLEECDQEKKNELTQKYKELLKAKEKIDTDHNKIVEKVSSFEIKFSEIMGKKISFENALDQLEIHLRKEQRNKASLLKELEKKTQASQNVAQLKVEIENLRKQELEMKKNKEEMERKIQELTKANNALKFQYDILHVKYNREKKDKVVPFTKY